VPARPVPPVRWSAPRAIPSVADAGEVVDDDAEGRQVDATYPSGRTRTTVPAVAP
jgi:hypothetical protein